VRAEDPASGVSRTMIAPDSGALRRSYGGGSETGTSTTVTAEIPAVPAGPNYGVLLPDGTIWYPGSQKRLPAPLLLRIVVWSLAFLVLIAGAGDFVIHTHPNWAQPLRRMVPTSGGTGSATTIPTKTGGSTPKTAAVSVSQTKPQPAGLPSETTAYTVTGTSSYQLIVKAAGLTWIQACKVAYGFIETSSPLFSGDIQPGQTETISVSTTSPIDLQVAASGATVTVLSGGKLIGTVAAPPHAPWHFRFNQAVAHKL
jgi:hypothetical protein